MNDSMKQNKQLSFVVAMTIQEQLVINACFSSIQTKLSFNSLFTYFLQAFISAVYTVIQFIQV